MFTQRFASIFTVLTVTLAVLYIWGKMANYWREITVARSLLTVIRWAIVACMILLLVTLFIEPISSSPWALVFLVDLLLCWIVVRLITKAIRAD